VQIANHSGQIIEQLYRQLDAERERSSRLVDENQRLEKELERAKLELKLERQNKFATNQQKNADAEQDTQPTKASTEKKKGARVGHPGWFRQTPTEYDWAIKVAAPRRCPHCGGRVSSLNLTSPVEHLQEDIIDNVYRVVCYQHEAAKCDDCGRHVQQAGEGEILGSRIGPALRSIAA
jgi:regulator of replication initiation timing